MRYYQNCNLWLPVGGARGRQCIFSQKHSKHVSVCGMQGPTFDLSRKFQKDNSRYCYFVPVFIRPSTDKNGTGDCFIRAVPKIDRSVNGPLVLIVDV